MSQIIILGGTGGGGADLEGVTATRNQALTTAVTYFTTGVEGEEPVLTNGTMKDFSAQATRPLVASVSLSETGVASGKLTLAGETDETGYYSNATEFQINISGQSNLGTATAAMVRQGYTFSSANGFKVEGTLATYNGEVE